MNSSNRNSDPLGVNQPGIASRSSRPKPRLVKLRKQVSSSNTKSKQFPDVGDADPGFNPFRPSSEKLLVPDLGTPFTGNLNFGGDGEGAFVFGASKGNASGLVENKVIDEMRKLKITNQAFLNSKNHGLNLHPSEDENSRLEDGLRKLKIANSVPVDSSDNENVMKPHLGATHNEAHFSSKNCNNRVNLFSKSAENELPNELNKLNIKDKNAEDVKTFVNRNTAEGIGPLPGTSASIRSARAESVLSNEMESLKLPREDGDISGESQTCFDPSSTEKPKGVRSVFPAEDFTFQASTANELHHGAGTLFISNPEESIFTGLVDGKLVFNAKTGPEKDARSKKKRGKLKKIVTARQGFTLSRSSLQEHDEDSIDSYSPMDVSPYCEPVVDNEEVSRETSVAPEEASHESTATNAVNEAAVDEDLVIAAQHLDINDHNEKFTEAKAEDPLFRADGSFDAEVPKDGLDPGAETESFITADVKLDYDSSDDSFVTAIDTEVNSNSRIETERQGFSCGSISEDVGRTSFTFSAASSSVDTQSSASIRRHKKKNRYKVAQDSYSSTPSIKVEQSSSCMQFFQPSETSSLLSPRWGQRGDILTPFGKRGDKFEAVKEKDVEQESLCTPAASVAAQEACEKWRLRGNQAYANGDMLRAEDYYSQGVNCISQHDKSRSCLRALMLCYSNRAAARISLGRLREALGDCRRAAAIDPEFLKVQIRAANCYLGLGEIDDASLHFTKCLQLRSDACADQKLALEASEGLEKAQKVSKWMQQSTELVLQRTSNAAASALGVISEALKISAYSEKLLELKAEALFVLQKYEELIHLCEQTLPSAEMNCAAVTGDLLSNLESSDSAQKDPTFKLWRWCRIIKSFFCLGRLEAALEFLKKQEERVPNAESKSTMFESSIPLVVTIRKLVHHKAAGNEAFQSGNYVEAVEHYSTALSCTVESHPFAAVCFCNRAAAYKAMGQVIDAIADCSIAIALDRNYFKAVSRRAALFEMVRDHDQAIKDLQKVASLLAKQLEDKVNQSASYDKSSCMSELRIVQQRLAAMEEAANQEVPMNMYLILGVDPSASASEIKKAYRKSALRHHPDKACQSLARSGSTDDGRWKEVAEEVHKDADRLFKMIGEAYATLSDTVKRYRYDMEEEMRNVQRRSSGGSRMHTDNYPI